MSEQGKIKGYVVRGIDIATGEPCHYAPPLADRIGSDGIFGYGPDQLDAAAWGAACLRKDSRDVRIFAVAEDGAATPLPTYEEAVARLAAVGDTLVSLMTTMATSARDWSSSKDAAWLYGIVCGWDEAALADLPVAYDWPAEQVDRLRRLREGFVRALPSGGEGQ